MLQSRRGVSGVDYFLVILATVAVIFGGKAFWDWRKSRTPRLNLDALEADRAQYLQENFEKAMADFNWLEEARKKFNDRELSGLLSRMQRVAKNLLAHLKDHPERIPLAHKFIDYYQDRAVKIVQQYQDLEATQLTTDRVQDLKDRMKSNLSALNEAYTAQFEHILNDQMLSADAELTVMEQQLDSEGIPRRTLDDELDDADDVRIDTDLLDQPLGGNERRNLPVMATKRRGNRSADRQISSRRTQQLTLEEDRPKIVERKLIQSALAIFFGAFGAHKFYQGKTAQGILYLVFAWTTIPTWVGFFEGVRYLFMPVEDFYEQYIKRDEPSN